MKTFYKSMMALAAASVLSVSANAAVSYGQGYVGQPYVGVKVGQFKSDLDNLDTKNPTAYGVYAGYNFDPNFGAEVEYVGSDKADAHFAGVKGDFDVKSYGAYGTYRYFIPNTAFYGKGKIGIARTEANGEVNGLGAKYSDSESKTGLAGGIGLGFQPTANFGIEAEYAKATADADLLTLGANLRF